MTLSKSVIAKEQDRNEVIKTIARLLQRLAKLYMVPGWTEENAVILAEWTFDNYLYEEMGTIIQCLENPPDTYDERGLKENNWRLTPDRIQRWMAVVLEKQAAQREAEHQKLKNAEIKEPLPDVDYESFKKRLAEGAALKEVKSEPWLKGGDDYSKFKAQRMAHQLKEEQNREGNE